MMLLSCEHAPSRSSRSQTQQQRNAVNPNNRYLRTITTSTITTTTTTTTFHTTTGDTEDSKSSTTTTNSSTGNLTSNTTSSNNNATNSNNQSNNHSNINTKKRKRVDPSDELHFEIRTRKQEASPQSWTQLTQELFWFSSSLCGKAVRESFRREAMAEADTFLTAYYLQSSRHTRKHNAGYTRQYVGIVNLKEFPHQKQLYVDLICASPEVPRLGSTLMQQVEQYARVHRRKFNHIQLSSLAYVINFYRKLGFKNTLASNGAEDEQVTLQCQHRIGKEQHTTSVETLRFLDDDQASKHRQFRTLLNLLVKLRLVKDKSCFTVKACNIDGYIMTKSMLKIKPQQPQQPQQQEPEHQQHQHHTQDPAQQQPQLQQVQDLQPQEEPQQQPQHQEKS